MKKITLPLTLVWLGLLFGASTCLAQMYTVTDLGTLREGTFSTGTGINNSGQVIGVSDTNGYRHGFRTAANSPINPDTDDLGTLGGHSSDAQSINASGQVVGTSYLEDESDFHGFRTSANSPINPDTDDLGWVGTVNNGYGINDSGQAAGFFGQNCFKGFRTAPNAPITEDDDIGFLGGICATLAYGVNGSGQVAGRSALSGYVAFHAFRTAANSPINPNTDDLGTLGGTNSGARAINASGQVAGTSGLSGDAAFHAFRTAANSPINPNTDDLGTLGGTNSSAYGINRYGEVVGMSATAGDSDAHGFVYSGGAMHDLQSLIPADFGGELITAAGINDAGQITADGCQGAVCHAMLLTPIFKATVQPPIHAEGSSVFKATRRVLQVKFTLTESGAPACSLSPATIAVTRTAGEKIGPIDPNLYATPADDGSNFRTDLAACQYIYNLGASALGTGTYQVDININGISVGHAVFALQ
jgi:probable HAF family extracellular repeat protein